MYYDHDSYDSDGDSSSSLLLLLLLYLKFYKYGCYLYWKFYLKKNEKYKKK